MSFCLNLVKHLNLQYVCFLPGIDLTPFCWHRIFSSSPLSFNHKLWQHIYYFSVIHTSSQSSKNNKNNYNYRKDDKIKKKKQGIYSITNQTIVKISYYYETFIKPKTKFRLQFPKILSFLETFPYQTIENAFSSTAIHREWFVGYSLWIHTEKSIK